MGAGGGCFFLAPPEKHEQIRNSLSQIKVWVPFKIDNTGSQVIFYNGNCISKNEFDYVTLEKLELY